MYLCVCLGGAHHPIPTPTRLTDKHTTNPKTTKQVDAFPALGQEANIQGWKTEDRPALQDIYGAKKGAASKAKNGNGAEQLAA